MSEKDDYFNYVIDVLGIKMLLLEPKAAADVTTTSAAVSLLVSVEHYTSYNEQEKELLVKMLSAMKIEPEQIRVVDSVNAENQTYSYCLELRDQLSDERSSHNIIQSYSPRTLLKKPELKKMAWSDLQKIMAIYSK